MVVICTFAPISFCKGVKILEFRGSADESAIEWIEIYVGAIRDKSR
jgi:hypothetical protein